MPLQPSRLPVAVCLRAASILIAGGALAGASQPARAASALPQSAGSLKLVKPPTVFPPATLEQHIDGEGEAMKRYDFRLCTYGEYAPGGRGAPAVTADVFQFANADDAFGYYSGQSSTTATPMKIGAEGYQERSALNFWKGPNYVRLTITAANPAPLRAQLPILARAIASHLSGSTSRPAILRLLPPGYTPRTEQYRRSDIAAQSYLRNGVLARYPSAGQQAELFVVQFPSAGAAKAAYAKYAAYLTGPSSLAMGARPSKPAGVGDSAVEARTRFTGEVVAAVKSRYVIAVRKAKDVRAATALVKAAASRAH